MKKPTAKSLTIKHKKALFSKNRKEEEEEDEGKRKHYKHEKHMKKKGTESKCAACGSMKHATHMHKHMKKKAALQTNAARFETMRKKVFGLK